MEQRNEERHGKMGKSQLTQCVWDHRKSPMLASVWMMDDRGVSLSLRVFLTSASMPLPGTTGARNTEYIVRT